MRETGTLPWATVAPAIPAPPFAVTGLQANTVYDFQVYAVNGAGSGPPAVRLGVPTGAAAQPPPGAPGPVVNLVAQPGAQADSQARLTWTGPAPAPQTYVVQYRTLGTLAWSTASGTAATPYTVTGLEGGTDYEFQVFAVNAGIAGQPSSIAALRTADRMPRWSDLVISGDGANEVDVTRVQMLLFTVIAAVFVAMKLLAESDIPDIPSGILTLMGLSNGVYLGAKFITGSR
jgi:cellulose 1,4-beta-cellobiosidase